MTEKEKSNLPESNKISRRGFIGAASTLAAGVALVGCSSSSTDASSDSEAAVDTAESTTELTESAAGDVIDTARDAAVQEPEIQDMPDLEVTEYDCDILVVGGGWAGTAAAAEATARGLSCVCVDKGRPGYSGYTPWANSFQFFEEEYGDDAETWKSVLKQGGEWLANQTWYDKWIEESHQTYKDFEAWGILQQYDNSSITDTDYYADQDWYGYNQWCEANGYNRHTYYKPAIEDAGVTLVEHTMITDIIEEDGKVVGAVGVYVWTGQTVTITCKAVIMATGAGCYKPAGYPTGTSTLDASGIAYRHGVAISGEEFNDFHGTDGNGPGDASGWLQNWTEADFLAMQANSILEEGSWSAIMTTAPDSIAAGGSMNTAAMSESDRPTGPAPSEGESDEDAVEPGGCPDRTTVEGDPRVGSQTHETAEIDPSAEPQEMEMRINVAGSAIGMGVHKAQGIWSCTDEHTDGSTTLPGLYAAGDSLASYSIGVTYYGVGFSSSMSAVQGRVVCDAACDYASNIDAPSISDDVLAAAQESVQAPLMRTTGYDPNWARELLQATMSPYWVTCWKTEKSLSMALTNVEFLRDTVIPQLCANNAHELKLCHEMENKIVAAEAKCRASLARKESRGLHYRADYPFRDDENFLGYITCQPGADGTMETSFIAAPADWVGDTTQDYATRYLLRFPGEAEALGLSE